MSKHEYWPTVRREGKRLAGWGIVFLFVVLTVTTVVLASPFQGFSDGIDRVEADEGVTLSETDRGYVLEPADTEPEAGLVFYPGARVDPNAYIASLAPVAREANVTVVVPRMPLTLAIVDYGVARTGLRPDTATAVMNAHSDIETWYVGGHSLGGAMACRYATVETDRIEGVVLYTSYCDQDISDSGLSVLNVVGEGDTVMNRQAFREGRDLLPPNATVVELSGLNHTQFGSYTGQSGDTPTGTSYETAHARLNDVVVPWFQNETAR
jgi:hypothetical protein